MKLTKAHIPAIAWSLFIGTSCLLPASAFKEITFDSFFELDKLIHLILYFVLVMLWGLSTKVALGNAQRYLMTVASLIFGLLVEILQSTMALGRTYDINDIVANSVGCALGMLTIPFVRRKLPLLKKHFSFLNFLYQGIEI